jgi:hypothetical protein
MAQQTQVIGTYNMSFMSDKTDLMKYSENVVGPLFTNDKSKYGKIPSYASEAAFLSQLEKDGKIPFENRRLFWEYAKTLLNVFIIIKNPIAVGLQEMNVNKSCNPTEPNITGTCAVESLIDSINTSYKKKYTIFSNNVEKNNAGLSIIFDSIKLGNIKKTTIFDNENFKGRPTLLVLTTKNYLLINTHGAQDPGKGTQIEEFNIVIQEHVKNIVSETEKFLEEEDVVPEGIFIMGDFNDRFDSIREITIKGKELKQTGDAPRSCCYNYDSSCPMNSEIFVKLDNNENGYCNVKKPDPIVPLEGENGFTKNYRNAGDKVFTSFPTKKMQIFPGQNNEKLSKESDHQLVYAEFNNEFNNEVIQKETTYDLEKDEKDKKEKPESGGRRKPTKKHKRKTRKYRRKTHKKTNKK